MFMFLQYFFTECQYFKVCASLYSLLNTYFSRFVKFVTHSSPFSLFQRRSCSNRHRVPGRGGQNRRRARNSPASGRGRRGRPAGHAQDARGYHRKRARAQLAAEAARRNRPGGHH